MWLIVDPAGLIAPSAPARYGRLCITSWRTRISPPKDTLSAGSAVSSKAEGDEERESPCADNKANVQTVKTGNTFILKTFIVKNFLFLENQEK
jgi:hypothetical protein